MGHESLYLGQSTPLFAVVAVNSKWKADILITGLMSGFPDINMKDYLTQLCNTFPKQIVLAAGALAETALKIKLPNVFALRSSDDLKSFL
jgi:hypothetical protein